jgi:hypothetical protein
MQTCNDLYPIQLLPERDSLPYKYNPDQKRNPRIADSNSDENKPDNNYPSLSECREEN